MKSLKRPYVLYVAEKIYFQIVQLKKQNPKFSKKDCIKNFIGSELYNKISTGEFHDNWFVDLKQNNFIDFTTQKKIPDETIKLLQIQKNVMIKQLIKFPSLYNTKNNDPLEISNRALNHLWRMCESYELWCKETKQEDLIVLNLIDQEN